LIATSFGKIKIKKDDISGLSDALDAFAKMHGMIEKVSSNFFKMIIKFNPLRGRIAGWSFGGFYQGFMQGLEKKLGAGKIIEKFKAFSGKDTENLGANLTGFSNLMQVMLNMDWKQLLKVGIAWKMFPASAGQNIANFMSPIIECINSMPEALQNTKSTRGMFGIGTNETT